MLDDLLRSRSVSELLTDLACLAGATLTIASSDDNGPAAGSAGQDAVLPIRYGSKALGHVQAFSAPEQPAPREGAHFARKLLEHALDRETAIADCAEQMLCNYEELNLLYGLLPMIATKVSKHEIAEMLVQQTSDTLNCRRVSLLELDESGHSLRVLASRGLPPEVEDLTIPVAHSVAGSVVARSQAVISGDMQNYPELAELSRGIYDTTSFAVIRVPMQAQGTPVGVLTVTEKFDGGEFTARDHKLMEGLSAIGSASLLNCRLHSVLNQQMMNTIKALACAVDAKDHYTHDHSGRVALLSVAAARKMGHTGAACLREIELAGLLHDVGKIGIPDAILSKPGVLTSEEYAIIRRHAEIGASIVRKVQGLEGVATAIEHHHERYDGLGYPRGLAGDDIPLASKLIAVSDTFDSVTSNRAYRTATSPEKALEIISINKGTQFDPEVIDAFCAVVRESMVLANPGPPANLPEMAEV